MIDGREKRNGHLAFELQNSHVCEKRSKVLHCFVFHFIELHCYYYNVTSNFQNKKRSTLKIRLLNIG